MLQILLTAAAGVTGYLMARNFVRNRLRFVDAVHSAWAPIVAAVVAFTFAWPLALLPLFSASPALTFATGTGRGTSPGARIITRPDRAQYPITPLMQAHENCIRRP